MSRLEDGILLLIMNVFVYLLAMMLVIVSIPMVYLYTTQQLLCQENITILERTWLFLLQM